MKKSKEELVKYLTKVCGSAINKGTAKERVKAANDKYELPYTLASDMFTLRNDLSIYGENLLFYVLDIINPKIVSDYYTDAEIKEYSRKYKKEKIKFPIRWKMIQVADDQWIGTIHTKELMQLRDAQLIRYNENTQRTLKHISNKIVEYWQIDINRPAVSAITESFNNDTYIPNTITLNIPEYADFKYTDGELIIRETDSLDILDGYHRYIAMSNMYNINPNFDYTMELRVVCFTEDKAKQFIWQEDQKTKMTKMDSNTFNQNNPSNQVINLINQNSLLKNIISRNDGVIDMGIASVLIDLLYFNTTRVINREMIVKVKNELIKKLTQLMNDNPVIFNYKWDYPFTMAAFITFSETDDFNYIGIKSLAVKYDENKDSIGRNGVTITSRIISRAKKMYEEVQ